MFCSEILVSSDERPVGKLLGKLLASSNNQSVPLAKSVDLILKNNHTRINVNNAT